MKPIHEPNYTQVPNYILDHLADFECEAELKVVIVVARQTFGWHKDRDVLSLSQLVSKTGMSRHSVIDGLERAMKNDWIERVKVGNSFSYAVAVKVAEHLQGSASAETAPGLVQKLHQPVVQKLHTQNKALNKGAKGESQYSLTTTTTTAAAAGYVNGWEWGQLLAAGKLPKKRAADLMATSARPASYVGNYLYGLAQKTINMPALWASKQLIDDPTSTAGGVFEIVAELSPAQLAALCGWIRDGGQMPELGQAAGPVLAWRGFMARKYSQPEALATAADQIINDLGLTALVPEPPPPLVLEREAAPVRPSLDAWQTICANGLAAEVSAAALTRLRACKLVKDNGAAGLVVGVPNEQDYQWLSRQAGPRLAQLYQVELVPAY